MHVTFSLREEQTTAQGLVIMRSSTPYGILIPQLGKYHGAAGELLITPVSDTQGTQTSA